MTATIRMHGSGTVAGLGLDFASFHFSFAPDYSSTLARSQKGSYVLFELPDERGTAVYVPAVLRRRAFLAVLRFLHPPANAHGENLGAEQERKVMEQLLDFIRSRGIAHRIAPPFNWCLFRSAPEGAVSCAFGSYVLDLDRPPAELWSGLHSKHRNVIRNAKAKGAVIRDGAGEVAAFHRLYSATMAKNHMPAEPLEFFQELVRRNPDAVHCGVVYHEEVPQGAVLVPYTKHGAYYVYGASADHVTPTGAINLLHHEMITRLQARGVRKYDFVGARLSDVGGTRLEGIQKFKERFGGRLETGCLWKLDVHPLRCRAFDTLLALKATLAGRSVARDIVDQERAKEHAGVPLQSAPSSAR